LYLLDNQLIGRIPASIGTMSSIATLWLGTFSCDINNSELFHLTIKSLIYLVWFGQITINSQEHSHHRLMVALVDIYLCLSVSLRATITRLMAAFIGFPDSNLFASCVVR